MFKFDKIDRWLIGSVLVFGALAFLTACSSSGGLSDGWLPASRDFATEVAADNAEAAKTNPLSAIVHGVASVLASLAGAGVIVRRGIKAYDDAPYEGEDGERVEESRIVAAVKKVEADADTDES